MERGCGKRVFFFVFFFLIIIFLLRFNSAGMINMSNGFSTSAIGSGTAEGITTNNSDFWIVDLVDLFVYHTNRTGGNITDGFSTSAIGANYPLGIITNGSDFWIVDRQDYFVYHTNRTGGNITNGFSTSAIGSGDYPLGITTNGSDFWITDNNDLFVYHTNRTGGNMSDGFSTSAIGSGFPAGITTNGSDFWITDAADYFVYHTNRTGGNITDGFSTSALGSTSPVGITTNVSTGSPTDFWILDDGDDFVYHVISTTCTSCSDCSAQIANADSGEITLNNSITTITNGTCIDFGGKDNFIFDCQNYSNFIQGPNSTNTSNYGIYLNSSNGGSNNNVIRNCNISQFYYGIFLSSSSNNTVINVTTNNNIDGVYLSSSNNNNLTNIITNNNTGFSSISSYGIYLTSSSNNILKNIMAINSLNYNNQYGIYLISSSYNVLTNITASYYRSGSGIYLDSSSNSNNLSNIIANNNTNYGIFLRSSNNNRVINAVANNNTVYGIFLQYTSSNNIFINITANYNVQSGIYLDYSTPTSADNSFTNITVQENKNYDISFSSSKYSKSACNNNFTNINGSGGRAIEHYNYPAVIQNKTLSELILCNASYSNINNVTIIGSDINRTNTFYILSSDNMNISNINSSQNYRGIYLFNSYNNTLRNITSNYNTQYGILLQYSNNNNLINVTANNNAQYGIYIPSSNHTFITNATVNNNAQYGILLIATYSVFNNTIINSILKENGYADLYLSVPSYPYVSTPLSCNNNFTNNIGSGDRAIEYYNYPAVIQNKILSELILCNASYSNVNNVTINGSDSLNNGVFHMYFADNINVSNVSSHKTAGILLKYSNNATLTNIISNNGMSSSDGIDIYYSNNTIITNAITNNNYDGTYLYQSNGIIVTNLTSNNNLVRYGLVINGCNNSVFTNIVTNNNRYDGITLSGYNNTLTNVITNNNTVYAGISLTYSNGTVLTNITANGNNLSGIHFRIAPNSYITIKDSHIENNLVYGLYFQVASSYNLIYNNYFNNTVNYRNNTNMTNFFNTTKTSGTNIVGGDNIGGNFWGYPNGTGFSQVSSTCIDADSDEICDSSYDLDGLNLDYLPLMLLASSISGGTNETSGTGGSTGSGAPPANQTINPDNPAEILINNSKLDLIKIIVDVLEAVSGVSFTITKTDILDINEQIGISGILYQAFNITAKGITNDKIRNVTLEFKVNKTWLSQNNGTSSDIRLHRKANSSARWEVLLTTLENQDNSYYYFSSLSPGFSTFVVFFGKYECQPGANRCYNEQSQLCLGNSTWLITEKCKFGCENGKCIKTAPQSVIVYTLMIAIVSVGIIITSYLILAKIFGRKRE